MGAMFLFGVVRRVRSLIQRCSRYGLGVCPSVDVLPAIGGVAWDLLQPKFRQLVWGLLIASVPLWVHVGYPCTFWSAMAHFTRRRDPVADESTRLQQLVFIIFARQVGEWRVSRWRHFSFENPPRCRSWKLDVVRDMISRFNMFLVDFDCCMYGAVDPGNGLA